MHLESADLSVKQDHRNAWWTPRLAGPLIAAALIRFTLMAVALSHGGINNLIDFDTVSYLEPGRNLLLHGRFVSDGMPELFRTPGYPLFLALTSLGGLFVAAVVNVILSVISTILVWRLGRRVSGNERIALGAAWIFAFEPLSVSLSVRFMSDTLFLALFLLSMERIAEFLHGRSLRVLAVAGLWLAAATFVRPVSYYLPIALAVGLFLVLARVTALRWKAPAVLLISVLPWLAAWQIRNWVETGYGGFASVTEENLYYILAADMTARVEHRSLIDVENEFDQRCGIGCGEQTDNRPPDLARNPASAGSKQSLRLAFMRAEALRIIRAHPGLYLRELIVHFFETAFYPGSGTFDKLLYPGDSLYIENLTNGKGATRAFITIFKAYPWVAAEKAAFVAVLMGLYLLAARGVFRGDMPYPCLWLLLGTSLYFLAVSAASAGSGVSARYRLPVMPAVCILAAAGVPRAKTSAR
jgi:hypothetical protein